MIDPKTGEKSPFPHLDPKSVTRQAPERAPLEGKAAELAERYWAFQAFRRGRAARSPADSREARCSNGFPWPACCKPIGTTRRIRPAKFARRKRSCKRRGRLSGRCGRGFQRGLVGLPRCRAQGWPAVGQLSLGRDHRTGSGLQPLGPVPCRLDLHVVGTLGVCSLGRCGCGRCIGPRSGFYATGVLAMAAGFGCAGKICRHVPVTNMYESVVFVGFAAALFGVFSNSSIRKRYALVGRGSRFHPGAGVGRHLPAILDPGIRPLTPILRSNFWLAIHVMTIMLSYAAFAMALLIGNITLGFYLDGRRTSRHRRAEQGDVPISASGRLAADSRHVPGACGPIMPGGVSGVGIQGVWALITPAGLLALLHARRHRLGAGSRHGRFSVLCFALILMAWYG